MNFKLSSKYNESNSCRVWNGNNQLIQNTHIVYSYIFQFHNEITNLRIIKLYIKMRKFAFGKDFIQNQMQFSKSIQRKDNLILSKNCFI